MTPRTIMGPDPTAESRTVMVCVAGGPDPTAESRPDQSVHDLRPAGAPFGTADVTARLGHLDHRVSG